MSRITEVSLLCSAYKVYIEIIRGRLDREVEKKKLLAESQAGFRKGRWEIITMDNIYVLNHLVQRVVAKGIKKEKVFALFVDLKAAFDKVNRAIGANGKSRYR